ncbi:glutathione-dependent formaldehyde dehydrogenase [Halalkalibacter wakoensis JCM 9140]|uniref:Glutathione-dependent formaldehyde dehydrogenase n=1 Tax=Halalkalibacter wakoensis JCM 9140 TaxID=1236970 RepID=W4PYT6_9BACI|nr:glutathione-dependent formaldehyde dehydrogenase [Halalkalibacter wakoensis JCM 9140]
MPYLHDLISEGKVDLSDIITHKLPIERAKFGYDIFDTKRDDCIKVVLQP